MYDAVAVMLRGIIMLDHEARLDEYFHLATFPLDTALHHQYGFLAV